MYKVIVDDGGCEVCGKRATWTIEDEDTEVCIGMAFEDLDQANELCKFVNAAHTAGRQKALVECGSIDDGMLRNRVAGLEEIIKALADVRGVEVPEGKHAGCGRAGSNAQVDRVLTGRE
ncbi:MAG: hypothetical protein PHT95_03200 [Candidatus Omnitrophica bacterium]|nr:hypothetical protein [Candidatus Omnitrophota bacterium]